MLQLLSALGVFVGTNLDDLIVLTTLFATGVDRRAIIVGQYVGVGALVAISIVVAFALTAVPSRWVGLFGVVPLALGVRGLIRHGDGAPKIVTTLGGVIGLTVANGADNVTVYSPVFREAGLGTLLYVAVFVIALTVWLLLARWLAQRQVVAASLDRWGHWLVPVVFITIGGLLILGSISN